ncbi:hypothetical protein bcgnr5378_09010 [Bacillus cereus]|uniref:Uncharacterized protein n=1 Tax=Bacillus cereus TaxID=1396 RepID=A0A164QES1_BACCE|nr:hypothetical protein [Bacillus cereus]KZD71213.1 hypothetical protein B4088_0943 [Bacillus cereus]HDR8321317.1 hypothetical protein [Bacillus cereus]HDR8331555.1 hypothetical protein [Bacillus cereus]HDR8334286.1 hypothetical protein [Bacillus cereus]
MNVIIVKLEDGTKLFWQDKVEDTDVKAVKADAYEYYAHYGEPNVKIQVLPQS